MTRQLRDQWWRLVAPAVNFTHKAGCAAVFGYYGLQVSSWTQMAALTALQVRSGRRTSVRKLPGSCQEACKRMDRAWILCCLRVHPQALMLMLA